VLREFGEELFDIEELERDRGYVAFDWFYEAPPGAAAYYLGLGVAADTLVAKGIT